ncbi:MAG TPA: protein phosphatase 2C domain-containing protein [Gammaproteobacteria bacterium]
MLQLQLYGGTDRGLVRKNNEDSIGFTQFEQAPITLAMVADGVGGYNGGEIASRLAVDNIEGYIRNAITQAVNGGGYTEHWMEQVLANSIEHANRIITTQQQQDQALNKMACTIVSVLIKDDQLALAYLGDSRCYRWRYQSLQLLTHDHTVAQQMLDQNIISQQDYRFSPYHHVLSHALGLDAIAQAKVDVMTMYSGDRYMLCSDGLTNCLTDDEIADVMLSYTDIQQCTEELITKANDNGGHDNISVVLLQVD